MILHAPGNGNIDEIINKFNYKLTKEHSFYRIKYYKSFINNFSKYFITEIIILFIILFIIIKKYLKKV